jgi:hypothetical protein
MRSLAFLLVVIPAKAGISLVLQSRNEKEVGFQLSLE